MIVMIMIKIMTDLFVTRTEEFCNLVVVKGNTCNADQFYFNQTITISTFFTKSLFVKNYKLLKKDQITKIVDQKPL